MIYSKRIKTTMCLAATITAFLTVDFNIVDAVSLSTEKGIAGIAVSLDKFYNANNDTTLASVNVQTDAEVNTLNALSLNTGITEEATTFEVPVVEEEAAAKEIVVEEQVEEKVEETSQYDNTGISIADNYVNIRKEANTDSKVLGKLYKGSAATIIKRDGEWVKIKSGKVTGYINSEFLAIGFDAEELVDKYATKLATVNTTTLKVRKAKSIESECLTMIPEGEVYEVIKEYDKWVKISIDDNEEDSLKGYVSKDFVNIDVEFKKAISIKEEQEQLEREEAARKAEQEQLQRLQNQSRSNNTSSSKSNTSSRNNSSNKPSNTGKSVTIADDPKGSGSGSEIASYALKFVGNPYVYGGTSLTNGTDCSGFTQAVYRSYGYSIPRDSRSQAAGAGKKVDLGSLRAGDLVFYTGSSGSVNHVALYIGGGQVVHASSPRTGIKVSKVNYRSPYMARRVIN
ncbi:cell wall-associated NlpC family hydrolase [Mobilisporobacter senegalensis]|uniref:Cell wall-associated NlpC family hydrolase n=1 Tax=Mobilisporobacter senegalensis TaxID=1329262 RepID=A0A3N1X557_9FIRM|nr:C40 family peptidase [Mobilisporobacter senegalensis]ROR21914.1 cell wall-associated NlpC family hydrolase [Mobilisporobacter senegalensis]